MVGKAVNKPHLLASPILKFMTVSLFRGPKFLSKTLPVREFTFEQTKLILDEMNAGEKNDAITFDMNRVNQGFLKMFNPLSTNRTKLSNTLKQFVGNSRRIV